MSAPPATQGGLRRSYLALPLPLSVVSPNLRARQLAMSVALSSGPKMAPKLALERKHRDAVVALLSHINLHYEHRRRLIPHCSLAKEKQPDVPRRRQRRCH